MTTNLDQILEVIESAQVQADRNLPDRANLTAQIAQAMALQQIACALTSIDKTLEGTLMSTRDYQNETKNFQAHMASDLCKIMSHIATLAGTVREYEGDAMFRICHYD